MSKRITIVLTDEEYAALEQRAQQDRRSVRDMAAVLVTKPVGWTWTPDWTWRPQPYIYPNTITVRSTGTITNGCYACKNPGSTGSHTCMLSQYTAQNVTGTVQ